MSNLVPDSSDKNNTEKVWETDPWEDWSDMTVYQFFHFRL